MQYLIGLGNPGSKYENNRHNVGFMFVDYLVASLGQNGTIQKNWYLDKYTNAFLAKVKTNKKEYIFAKPQTFMNNSGEAVGSLIHHNELKKEDIMVAHDDLDIPLGKFRIVKGYGPKLHNGIESIENHLHTNDFFRIRIGVDNRSPQARIPGIDYVLHDFSQDEYTKTQSVFPNILSLLKSEYGMFE